MVEVRSFVEYTRLDRDRHRVLGDFVVFAIPIFTVWTQLFRPLGVQWGQLATANIDVGAPFAVEGPVCGVVAVGNFQTMC